MHYGMGRRVHRVAKNLPEYLPVSWLKTSGRDATTDDSFARNCLLASACIITRVLQPLQNAAFMTARYATSCESLSTHAAIKS